jgi:hypothetical protein
MKPNNLIAGLPGESLIREGLADCQAGLCTLSACLVSMARLRLTEAGLISTTMTYPEESEITLYRMLCQQDGDAYSRYNALLRELTSFETALDRRIRQVAS